MALVAGVDESWTPVASFTKEVNPRLAKPLLVFNGHLANRWLTSLVKEATVDSWGLTLGADLKPAHSSAISFKTIAFM